MRISWFMFVTNFHTGIILTPYRSAIHLILSRSRLDLVQIWDSLQFLMKTGGL